MKDLFINNFQTGTSENANIGLGTLVGIETYSRKGVARLSKRNTASTPLSFSWPSIPKYISTDGGQNFSVTALKGSDCGYYYSADSGTTWHDTGQTVTAQTPSGMIYFKANAASTGYYLNFAGTKLYYYTDVTNPNGGGGGTGVFTGLVAGEHPVIQFPGDGFIYFGNGNFIGKLGLGTASTFDPTGSSGTNFFLNLTYLTLPTIYTVTCLSFITPNYIAIGTTSSLNNPQVADVILWNPTLSTYETPLRLYCKSINSGLLSGVVQGGVAQIINRDNILYAVTAGNFAVYKIVSANSFSLITDISLHSNIRTTGGAESTYPVFIGGYAPAISFIGNKMLTGVSTINAAAYPTNTGLFPCGVWTLTFSDGGAIGNISYGINGASLQCEYTISTNTINSAGNSFQIGFIQPNNANSALISWADNTNYGIDKIETYNNQNTSSVVLIESEMMEIGTPLNSKPVPMIQLSFVRNLLTGQQVEVWYRTGFDKDFQLITAYGFTGTFTGDGTKNAYKIENSQIGQLQYLQLQIRMKTGSPNDAETPELRTVIITPSK